MNISAQYQDLTEEIKARIPLKAYPIRELLQIFRQNEHPITLKTELTITNVINSGDISGIMCTIALEDKFEMACALTHLVFPKTEKLYHKITNYQKKRAKRVRQLNSR